MIVNTSFCPDHGVATVWWTKWTGAETNSSDRDTVASILHLFLIPLQSGIAIPVTQVKGVIDIAALKSPPPPLVFFICIFLAPFRCCVFSTCILFPSKEFASGFPHW